MTGCTTAPRGRIHWSLFLIQCLWYDYLTYPLFCFWRPLKESADEPSPVRRTRNLLLEAGSGSSESDSDSSQEKEEPESSSLPLLTSKTPAFSAACRPSLPSLSLDSRNPTKLPPPSLNTCSDSSVFANPFKAQADQRLSALQKHVPLTVHTKPSQIGGKKVCVSYRKDGKCRFGIKCKFAHDSDLQSPAFPTDCHPPAKGETQGSDQAASNEDGGSTKHQLQETKEEESGGHMKKRRVGLSNTLIPPKRAMKQYAVQRSRERMNMSWVVVLRERMHGMTIGYRHCKVTIL